MLSVLSPMAVDLTITGAAECVAGPNRARCAFDVADPHTPETIRAQAETAELIAAAVSGLSERHAELLHLRYERDFTFVEIALAFDVTEPAVHQMHDRAIARVKQSLELMGVTS
jgi:RNA polymerase sigma factor (sigma-70 family)